VRRRGSGRGEPGRLTGTRTLPSAADLGHDAAVVFFLVTVSVLVVVALAATVRRSAWKPRSRRPGRHGDGDGGSWSDGHQGDSSDPDSGGGGDSGGGDGGGGGGGGD
jgi:hypothetical protein